MAFSTRRARRVKRTTRPARLRGILPLLLLPCLAGVGCSEFLQQIGASAQVKPAAGGGQQFVATDPHLSFPLSSAWSINRSASDTGQDIVRLHTQGGACALLITEHLDLTGDEAEHISGIAAILARDGHPITPLDTARVGTQNVPHIHSHFGIGVDEELYGLRSGNHGLTLITVHGSTCQEDFGPILQGVRL